MEIEKRKEEKETIILLFLIGLAILYIFYKQRKEGYFYRQSPDFRPRGKWLEPEFTTASPAKIRPQGHSWGRQDYDEIMKECLQEHAGQRPIVADPWVSCLHRKYQSCCQAYP